MAVMSFVNKQKGSVTMLIHGNEPQIDHVEFVEYTGKWPNLCSGILVLKIDGKEETFGVDQSHPKFWHPAGDNLMDISIQIGRAHV